MKRVGYDSDTGRYYYRGQGGPLWQGPQGAEYGELTRGESKSPPQCSQERCSGPSIYTSA